MAIRLFSLRGVPDDEADAIRELLTAHHIRFYETHAGNWGISSPAFWLEDDNDQEQAKALLREFQLSWTESRKEHHAQLKDEGNTEHFSDKLKNNPLQVLVYLAIVILVLYISTKPFISLGS